MTEFASTLIPGLMRLVWLMLLHATWLGILAGAFGSLATAMGRPARHRMRHAAFVAALAFVTIAAPISALAPRRPAARKAVPTFIHAAAGPAAPSSAPIAMQDSATIPSKPRTAPRWIEPFHAMIATAGDRVDAARPYLLATWAAGASACVAAILLAVLSSRRLRRQAVPHAALDVQARTLARRLRLRRPPAVGIHPRIVEPCLIGAVHPMVLLPQPWLDATPSAELQAVLAHELAHARRLDHLTNLFQRLVGAMFWFHPDVHRLSRLARREAEHAADSLAVRITGNPLALARALDSAARRRRSRRLAFPLGLAVGGDRSPLLPRIQELLGMKPIPPRFPFRILAAPPTAAALAWMAISTAPAQETAHRLDTIASSVVPSRQVDSPPDPAEAAWLNRVKELRARIENPESDAYAMGVLFRLVPGNPRLATSGVVDPRPRAEPAPADLPDDVLIRLASKRPWRLSHEDLVTLARSMSHGRGDVSSMSREELLHITDENQVCFEVRFFQVRHDPAEHQEADDKPVRLVPGSVLHGSIANLMRQFPKAALQAPKVTTFEGASATISLTDRPMDAQRMKAVRTAGDQADGDVRLIAKLEGPAPSPDDDLVVTSRLHGDLYLQLTGIRKPWGHAVEARFLGALPDDPKAPAAAPRTVERLARVNVPEGDGILLDTGIDACVYEKDDSETHLRTVVVITPRHIPNEREEEDIGGPVDEFHVDAR